ncbi:MAG: shikimate dehydrogenase family protein [Elusimicrobiales bacterium]
MIKLVLIGGKLKKSLSADLYRKLSEISKTKIIFKKIQTKNLKKAVEKIKKAKLNGFFITLPYKKEITKLTIGDKSVLKSGSANCVKISGRHLLSSNTDYKALKNIIKDDISRKKALIIGNGSSAQTAFIFLLEKGIKDITVAARNPNKNDWFKKFQNIKLTDFRALKEPYQIIINATPIGMYYKKNLNINLKNAELLIDFAYDKKETGLVKKAKKRKIKTIEGIEILANQAVEGIKFISGKNFKKYDKKLIKYLKRIL